MSTQTETGTSGTLVDPYWYETFFDEHWLTISSHTHTPEKSAAEVEFLISALGLEPGQRVLDIPCGHGRHSIELARRGLRVVGVDLNDLPLELASADARAAGVQLDLRRLDMREIEFRDEFDAVLNLWTSFGYFESEAEDRLVLERALRALRPGGALVIETINLHGTLRRFEPRAWHELGAGRLLLEERAFDPWKGRMHSGWTLVEPSGDRVPMSFATRAYTLVELTGMMAAAGFDVEAAWGDYQGSDYRVDSRRMIVLARRPRR
ncbi:MAG TPA: methyltransferase domain-containing protein [Gaiellales bacterium]